MGEDNQKQSPDVLTKLCTEEHKFLRKELVHLKECQIKFLTFSVTSTGVILGLVSRSHLTLTDVKLPTGNLWLLPLIILLPAWWVFFDKATTITRIVGYFRLLERLILKKASSNCFSGWESSLSKFRKKKIEDKVNIMELFAILTFRTTNRYWIITYYIFFSLSVLCWINSWQSANAALIVSVGLFILASAIYNARVLWSLAHGKYSYDKNEEKWREILEIVTQ